MRYGIGVSLILIFLFNHVAAQPATFRELDNRARLAEGGLDRFTLSLSSGRRLEVLNLGSTLIIPTDEFGPIQVDVGPSNGDVQAISSLRDLFEGMLGPVASETFGAVLDAVCGEGDGGGDTNTSGDTAQGGNGNVVVQGNGNTVTINCPAPPPT